jgi:hypothetical protein
VGGFLTPPSVASTVTPNVRVVARDTPAAPVALTASAVTTLATISLPILPTKATFRVVAAFTWFANTGQSVTFAATITDHAAATVAASVQAAGFKSGSPFYGGGSLHAQFQQLGFTGSTSNGVMPAGFVPASIANYNAALATVPGRNVTTTQAASAVDLTQASTLTITTDATSAATFAGDYFFTIVELLTT